MEKLWDWLAWKIAPFLVDYIQLGGHCGFCGKWERDVILWKPWAITICKECLKKYGESKT